MKIDYTSESPTRTYVALLSHVAQRLCYAMQFELPETLPNDAGVARYWFDKSRPQGTTVIACVALEDYRHLEKFTPPAEEVDPEEADAELLAELEAAEAAAKEKEDFEKHGIKRFKNLSGLRGIED